MSFSQGATVKLDHEDRFACEHCNVTFVHKNLLRQHLACVHLDPVNLSCKTCIALSSNQEELQTHISRAHDVRLHCPLCQKLFGDVALLRNHLAQEHGTEQWDSNVHAVREQLKEKLRYLNPDLSDRFICFYCNRAFREKNGLFTHLGCIHLRWRYKTLPSDMPQEETGCFKKSNNKIVGRFFKCYICRKSLTRRAKLVKHLRRHRASLPCFCKSCGDFSAHRNSMEVHWYEKHGKSVVRFTRIPRTVDFRLRFLSNFPCRYCNVYLKTETRRKRHESEKHAENYKCSGCNFACENMDIMIIHITVVHAKSDPKPSMVRRKLCPVATKSITRVQNQCTAGEKASNLLATPNLLTILDGITSSSIKMQTNNTNLLNFEFVECNSILQKPRTEKDPLIGFHSNLGSGLKVPVPFLRKNQNLVSILRPRGSQLTGSNSSTELGESKSSCSSGTSVPLPAESRTEIVDEQNKVPLSSTSAEAPNCGNAYNTKNQFFNVKEEMEFEDVVIKEESLDREGSITNPTTPFQVQALPNLTEVKSFKTEDLDLQQELTPSEALPETIDLCCVQSEEPILHHQPPEQSHALPARTESQLSLQEQIAVNEAQLRVRETAEDFHYQAYPCYLCTKMRSTRSMLLRHVVGAHLKVRLYECAYCARRCSREADVKQHSARAHPGQPEHVVTRFTLDTFSGRRDQAQLGMQGTEPPYFPHTKTGSTNIPGTQAESCGRMSPDSSGVGETNESAAHTKMHCNISRCSGVTDDMGAKVKAVPIPGTSSKSRRVTCRPYPDSLPPVPGGCLPCSVQL